MKPFAFTTVTRQSARDFARDFAGKPIVAALRTWIVLLLVLCGALQGALPAHAQPEAPQVDAAPLEAAAVTAVSDWARVRVFGDGVDVGRRPSLELHPSNNRPYVSFYDGANKRLVLAWRTGNGNDICSGTRGWLCKALDATQTAGDTNALAMLQDGSGQVAVAYGIPANKSLVRGRYDVNGNVAVWDGSLFANATYVNALDLTYKGGSAITAFEYFKETSQDKSFVVRDGRYGGDFGTVEWVATPTSTGLGRYASVDLGAGYNGLDGMTARVAYRGNSGALRYAEWLHSGGGTGCSGSSPSPKWKCTTVDPNANVYSTSLYAPKCENCGDLTRIAYFDASNGRLKIATRVGGNGTCGQNGAAGWDCSVIDTIAGNKTPDGVRVTMVVQNGQIKIAYTDKDDKSNTILKLATYTGNAAQTCGGGVAPGWVCEVVDDGNSQDNTGIEPSLAWKGGQLYIAYHNQTKGQLMVAYPKANLAGQVSFAKNYPGVPVTAGSFLDISYKIVNNSSAALTGLAFDDFLNIFHVPTSLVSNTCLGAVVVDAGNLSSLVRLTGGALAANASCEIVVKAQIRTIQPGVYDDPINQPLASNEAYPIAGSGQTKVTVKTTQTISFGALPGRTFGDAPFALSATASSGLPVAFSSTTPAVCTVAGATVTLAATGTCGITASQPGDAQYFPAPDVLQQFAVTDPAKQNQAITFAPLADKTLGDASFAVSAAASSGLPVAFASGTPAVCTVNGATVTLVAAGACMIVASQPGDAAFNPAPSIAQNMTVHPSGNPAQAQTDSLFLPVILR
jgi:hypothetical protein